MESGEVKFSGSQQEIVLMVSGLVVKQKDVIKPYNLIYQLVFNLQWVKQRLTELRPYSDQLLAWQHSDFQDNLCLLQGSELEKALIWSSGQNEQTLDELDLEFLSASQAWDKKQRNKKIIKFSSLGFLAGLVTFSLITYAHNWYKNYNFQYCSVLE